MSRELPPEVLEREIGALIEAGSENIEPARRLRLLASLRVRSPKVAEEVDTRMLGEIQRLRGAFEEALSLQRRTQQMLQELLEPPWLAATYLGPVESVGEPIARVAYGSAQRVVRVAPEMDLTLTRPGDEVFLNRELNIVVGRSTSTTALSGSTAVVQRVLGDGRLVIRSRDEEIVVTAAGRLAEDGVKPGDLVRWDRLLWLAFEKIERDAGARFFLEQTPAETFAAIGGLDRQIAELKRAICPGREHRELARKYRLRPAGSVLLAGPPGPGKTMLARALANWLAGQSASRQSRFMNIKPAGLHSSWYAESEANYREAFRAAREAGERDPDVPVVMFFDEVDAVGTGRGQWAGHRVDDRVLTAFMTELDGLEGRGNVVVVAATNRREALDPALLRPGRLGDLVLTIGRPNRSSAREIFGRHLDPALPYRGARADLIEAALSRLYAPNGEGELAVLTLGDRQTRAVRTADLVSGALIAGIARAATERAFARELTGGEAGLSSADLVAAVEDVLATAVESLSPANCHQLLEGLQPDQPVVRLERRSPLRVVQSRVA